MQRHFDLEEFLDAVFRAPVSSQVGPRPLSFMPPNGAISSVDLAEMMTSLTPTMPYFEPSADPPDAPDVAAVEIGREPLPSLPCLRGREAWGCRWPS